MELFEHVGITVSSLSRSTEFYNQLLGSEPFTTGVIESPHVRRLLDAAVDSLRVAFYRLPGTRTTLELVECSPGAGRIAGGLERPGQVHLCFFVKSLEDAARTLRAMGMSTPEAVALPGPDGSEAQTLFVRDPDGTPLQLIATSNCEPRF